jgi:hypothetical protein
MVQRHLHLYLAFHFHLHRLMVQADIGPLGHDVTCVEKLPYKLPLNGKMGIAYLFGI